MERLQHLEPLVHVDMLNDFEKSDSVDRTGLELELVHKTSVEFKVGPLVLPLGEADRGLVSVDADDTHTFDSSQTICENTGAATNVGNQIPRPGINPSSRLAELELVPESLRRSAARDGAILVVAADGDGVAGTPRSRQFLSDKHWVNHREVPHRYLSSCFALLEEG
ncbi:MAG: hypothetical protein ABSH35_17120 [Isosphaeraceae bacterium]